MTWRRLADRLHTVLPNAGDTKADKEACPAWSPCGYPEGATRAALAVDEVCALVLDYDEGLTIHAAADRWHGYSLVAHTTWSHSPELPKCRVVIPLAAPVAGPDWSPVYRWVVAMDGGKADTQCSDPSRLYFWPAVGKGGPHASTERRGRLMDLADVVDRTRAEEAAHAATVERERAARLAALREQSRGYDLSPQRRLRDDVSARGRLGDALGGSVVCRPSGEVVRGLRCPSCGRPSAWFYLHGSPASTARCAHRGTCGWWGGLHTLADLAGVSP